MYFSLYPSSVFSLGTYRACLADIGRSVYVQVPLDMGMFFLKWVQFPIEEVKKLHSRDYETVNDYIEFMVHNKFAMTSSYCPTMNYHALKRSDILDKPFLFDNIIVDANSSVELTSILRLLPSGQFAKYLQIRMFFIPNLSFLNQVGSILKEKDFFNTELVINQNTKLGLSNYYELVFKFRFHVSRIVLMNSELVGETYSQVLICKDKLVNNSQCGIISESLFCTNIDGYVLSQHHNSCLYKKISIDSEGNIRNCPSCSQSFGNIRDTTLEQALGHPDFKKYWSITKDQIDVCRDCEFRHMCTDCRVFIKDPDNMYSQPAKCPYNPYIARWKGEEGYVPVEECGTYTREAGFTPNPRRIAELNRAIWSG